MKKIILIVVGLVIILGAAGYFLIWQKNPYSKDAMNLQILGPQEISAGDIVQFAVKYKNNGNVRLENLRLAFEFPQGSIIEEMEGKAETGQRIEVGSDTLQGIYPGEEKTINFKCRLLGKEGETKEAKVWLDYNPKNLNANYESATTSTVLIKTVPLTFDFDLSSKAEAGKQLNFSINYFSNIDYPLTNFGIKVDYPAGFNFVKSSPKSMDQNNWDIPLLNKAEGGRISIAGNLSGDLGEQKIFNATLGAWINDQFFPLKEISRGVEIATPKISVFQQINGQREYVANPGDLLHYEIFFRNIGEDPFSDLFLVANLDGPAFDFNNVKVQGGTFSKEDNSITWDWKDNQKLSFLDQGEEGKVEFWIQLKPEWGISSADAKNAVLKNSVLISQASEEFDTKVSTKLAVDQKAYYQDEVFGNSGPFPTQPGQTTTYTITWQVKNYFNDAKGVKVKAILPQEARLTGKVFPEGEASAFTFDNQSREIVWQVQGGDLISAGTGVLENTTTPNISFQIAVAPRTVGPIPIIGPATITGDDQWTEATVEGNYPSLKSDLTEVPSITDSDANASGVNQ